MGIVKMAERSSFEQSCLKKATLGTAIEHQFNINLPPVANGIDSPAMKRLPSTAPSPATGKAATTAAVELLLEKCALGMPTRYSTTIDDDEGLNEVEAECLSWAARDRRLGILVSDVQTQIVAPDITPGTIIKNSKPQFADMLQTMLK